MYFPVNNLKKKTFFNSNRKILINLSGSPVPKKDFHIFVYT